MKYKPGDITFDGSILRVYHDDDGYIHIHSDNSVSLYCGSGEAVFEVQPIEPIILTLETLYTIVKEMYESGRLPSTAE